MSRFVAQFEGPFVAWSYTVGHGRLLLRRTKSGSHLTRVDVLFKDVGAISMPMGFDGLTVEESEIEEAKEWVQACGGVRTGGRRLYTLSGNGWHGQVVAAVAVWHEDDKEYFEPSALLE